MKRIIKKIDRVKKVEEVIKLEEFEADIICVSLVKDTKFSDAREVNKQEAINLKKHIKNAKFACEVSPLSNIEEIILIIEEVGFDYVQVSTSNYGNEFPSHSFISELKSRNIGIIYSGITVDYDDDESWIMNPFEEQKDLNVLFFDLNIFGIVENSWDFLKTESKKYPDELQIEDFRNLCQKYPMLITLDYTPQNVKEIINEIHFMKGITMTIADSSERNDIHYFNYSSVLDILKLL